MTDEALRWDEFMRVELRVGRVVSAEPFAQARQPAYVLQVDFGEGIGVRKSSAQVTDAYTPESLVGRLVVGVVNFPPKQIGPFRSEVLVTGAADAHGDIVLATLAGPVPNGHRLI